MTVTAPSLGDIGHERKEVEFAPLPAPAVTPPAQRPPPRPEPAREPARR